MNAASDLVRARQIETYHAQGYLVRRDVFSPSEMREVAAEAERLLERTDLIDSNNLRCRYQPSENGGPCLFETFDPVIDIAPCCARLAADRRIFHLLEQIYGGKACLFKDKLIFKPPGAHGYRLHQDYIAWKNFPRSFVTVLIAVDAADEENGCTVVYPGYHLKGCLTPEDGEFHELSADMVDDSRAVPLELEPGDVAFFGCFTPHRSAPNRSSRWRRQLYLSYTAERDGGDLRETHYRDFHAWLRAKYADYGKPNVYFR
ncbi:MAG TPA: phytanoyl-CoA dioxygenase family protein [Pirellulales bacterium]|nr:phytanoyl-CoA dioxygenase family protein [Pirellulales bacterium]